MAKQRYVNTRFWDDGYIITLDPTEKLLFIYLLTNPLTNIVGAYELSLRRSAFDTGIDSDTILKIFQRFEAAGKVYFRDGWVVIVNFVKHQSHNPKIMSGIRAELAHMPPHIAALVNLEYGPKQKAARAKITPAKRQRILDRDGHQCQFCQATEDLEIDHITPVAVGGSSDDTNLRVLCQRCNGKRNADLRWAINGDVSLSQDSLPTKMGGLSHLNSNSNSNFNSNENDTPAFDLDQFEYPVRELIEAFPHIQFQPTHFGFLEAEIGTEPDDRAAWLETVKIYRQNYDPRTNTYLPTKMANVLGVYRRERERITRDKMIAAKQRSNAQVGKPTATTNEPLPPCIACGVADCGTVHTPEELYDAIKAAA